jgi:predicted nuclease with TOPRIM domain
MMQSRNTLDMRTKSLVPEREKYGFLNRISELKQKINEIDREYSRLLEARQNLLTEIEIIEDRVRPMIQSVLTPEVVK